VNEETNNSTGNNEVQIQNKNNEGTRHHSNRSKIKEQLVTVWSKMRLAHMYERTRPPTLAESNKCICLKKYIN
jgi:hypothetical protein